MSQAQKLYTIPETAGYLGTCEQTVRNLIHDGQLRAVRIRGHYRVAEKILEDFISSGGAGGRKPRSAAQTTAAGVALLLLACLLAGALPVAAQQFRLMPDQAGTLGFINHDFCGTDAQFRNGILVSDNTGGMVGLIQHNGDGDNTDVSHSCGLSLKTGVITGQLAGVTGALYGLGSQTVEVGGIWKFHSRITLQSVASVQASWGLSDGGNVTGETDAIKFVVNAPTSTHFLIRTCSASICDADVDTGVTVAAGAEYLTSIEGSASGLITWHIRAWPDGNDISHTIAPVRLLHFPATALRWATYIKTNEDANKKLLVYLWAFYMTRPSETRRWR